MRILGKGNKVRILYLNDACQAALNRYLAVRRPITGRDANALFLSSQNERISRSTVHAMVKKRLLEAGLDATQYSSHKLPQSHSYPDYGRMEPHRKYNQHEWFHSMELRGRPVPSW